MTKTERALKAIVQRLMDRPIDEEGLHILAFKVFLNPNGTVREVEVAPTWRISC